MSFLLYQRADPRHDDWLQLKSQQIRLRNLVQIIGINLETPENCQLFFTLHVTPLSAPFFTSEKIPKKAGQSSYVWKEIEPEHAYYSGVKFSAKGCTIRIWSRGKADTEKCQPVLTWGVYFEGLYRIGRDIDWTCSELFENNVILIRTPFGVFTASSCIKRRPTSLTKHLVISKIFADCKPSYRCKLLASLHRRQRAIIEEVELAIQLKSECETLAFTESGSTSVPASERKVILSSRGKRIRPGSKKIQLALKKQIEEVKFKVLSLNEEKGRAEGRLQRIKKERLGIDEMHKELLSRIDSLNNERKCLQQFKITLVDKRQRLSQLRSDVFLRKKQHISDLSVIYPLTLIDSVKRYSINGVQLPESDYQGYEGGGQASVALGYTAHLVSMLCFFLGIPLRYPIRHFGSRSRIFDHITANIQEREREFPLYFKGKPDIFSIYGAYLLNKNIAQIRWYCGLVTQDLKATLPNLASLVHNRLAIKGWDQNYDDDSLEVAQELTEETDRILFRSDKSVSMDKGLDDLHLREDHLKEVQSNLSSSVSNIDYAGNNSVAIGDVYRGRAQEKFLTGWRKGGLAQPEDIDPSWLVSSMDADSDCGRRLSTCVNNSQQSDFETSLVSSLSDQNSHRRRRFGQVSLPEQFPNVGVSIPSSSRHTNPAIDTVDFNQFVQDDSVEAKQLRLLDRKISMYFGERPPSSASSRHTSIRRTRSFDKLVYNDSSTADKKFVGEVSNKFENASEGISVNKGATINAVGFGRDPYFCCNVPSDASDADTDHYNLHISPPIDIIPPGKSREPDPSRDFNDFSSNSSEKMQPKENESKILPVIPITEELSSFNHTKPGTSCEGNNQVEDNKSIRSNSSEDEDTLLEHGKTDHDRNNDLHVDPLAVLMGEERESSDESLWDRTEALMSSFQSFNLIRKSTVDPK